MSNYLVCQKTGRVVTIDFGYAFGISTSFLLIPELVQFRLTPQILAVMEPLGTHGLFRLAPFNLNFKYLLYSNDFFDDSLGFPFKLLNTSPCSRDIFICLIRRFSLYKEPKNQAFLILQLLLLSRRISEFIKCFF